jgi:hypothetical protein
MEESKAQISSGNVLGSLQNAQRQLEPSPGLHTRSSCVAILCFTTENLYLSRFPFARQTK